MSDAMVSANARGKPIAVRRPRWQGLWMALGALLVVGGLVRAVDNAGAVPAGAPACEEKCPVASRVSTLLTGWKTAREEMKGVPEAEHAKLKTHLAALAKECPVGSRLGETLGFVKAVLASTVQLEGASGKQCPIDASGDKAACDLKQARAKLIAGLDELAGYAAGACSGSCDGATAQETASLPERAIILLASWDRAPAEIAAIPAEKRQLASARLTELAGHCKAVTLIPPTVEGLRAGLAAVDELNGKLCDWAKAHPDVFKDCSAETKRGMATQMALLHATARILERSEACMKACGVDCGAEAKQETAAR